MKTDPPRLEARSVRAVVFDLDGTLIDTEGVFTEAARRLLAERGQILEPEFMAAIMGTPGRDALPRFKARYRLPDTVEHLAGEYRRFFFEVLGGNSAPLMAGAVELLDRLQERQIPLAIGTSSGRDYVTHVFGPHGLLGRFSFVLTAEDVVRGKPAPEIYLTAAAKLGVLPGDLVVIEDSVIGLQAAKAAGARCVVVPHVHTPRSSLANADAIVPSLSSPELWHLLGVE